MKYLLLLLLSFNVYGAEFIIEQGNSNSFLANPKYYTSNKYSAVAFRKGYVELIQGGWVGETYSGFYGLSAAFRTSGRSFFDGSVGLVRIDHYSGNQLEGKDQFTFSLGAGYAIDNLSLIVKLRHFSNGSKFFGGDDSKNRGVDFLIGGVGFSFN